MPTTPLPEWIDRLPAPVARARRVLHDLRADPAVDPWRTLSVLKDTFECLLQFAAAVALQETLAAGERNKGLRRSVLSYLAKPGTSAWQAFLSDACPKKPPAGSARAPLRNWLATRLDERFPECSTVGSAIGMLVKLRNVELGHHATGAEQDRHRDLVDTNGPLLDACLETFVLCHEGWRLVVADAAPAAAGHAVWSRPAGTSVDLHPILVFQPCPEPGCRDGATFFFYNRWQERAVLEFLDRATAHRLLGGDPERASFAQRYDFAFDRKLGTLATDQWARRLLQRFTGRSAELAALLGLVRDDDPGIVFLDGQPGIGKSALCAKLADALEATAFVHFVRGRGRISPGPEEFLAKLVEHLDRHMPASVVPDSRNWPALRDTALEQLVGIAKEDGPFAGRLVVVLDGLDESDAEGTLLAALEPLLSVRTPRVAWVLAGRGKNPMVRGWLEALERTGHPVRRLELGKLEPADIRRYLVRHVAKTPDEAFLQEVERRSGGNALYLELLVGLLARHGDSGAAREFPVPDQLAGLYETILLRFADLPPAAEKAALDVLALLAVARERLTIASIAGMLDVSSNRVAAAVRECGELLHQEQPPDGPDEFSLFHQSVADHLADRDRRLGAKLLRSAEERLADWCVREYPSARSPADYALRHAAGHLHHLATADGTRGIASRGQSDAEAAARRREDLFRLVDGPGLATKARLLGPSAAAADLRLSAGAAAAIVSSPDGGARLVRDLLRCDALGQQEVNLSHLGLFESLAAFAAPDEIVDRAGILGDPQRRAAALAQAAVGLHDFSTDPAASLAKDLALERLRELVADGQMEAEAGVLAGLVRVNPDLALAAARLAPHASRRLAILCAMGRKAADVAIRERLSHDAHGALEAIAAKDCEPLAAELEYLAVFAPERISGRTQEFLDHWKSHDASRPWVACMHARQAAVLWPHLDEGTRRRFLVEPAVLAGQYAAAGANEPNVRGIAQALAAVAPEWVERVLDAIEPDFNSRWLAYHLAASAADRDDAAALDRIVARCVYAPVEGRVRRLLVRARLRAGDREEARRELDRALACARVAHHQGGLASKLALATVALDATQAEIISRFAGEAERLIPALPTPGDRSRAWRDLAIALARLDVPRALAALGQIEIATERRAGLRWVAGLAAESSPDRAIELARGIDDPAARASAIATVGRALAARRPELAETLAAEVDDPGDKARVLRDAAVARAMAGDPAAVDVAAAIPSPLESTLALHSVAAARSLDMAVRERAADLATRRESTLNERQRSYADGIRAIQRAHLDWDEALSLARAVAPSRKVVTLATLAANAAAEDIVPSTRWDLTSLIGGEAKPALPALGTFPPAAFDRALALLREAVDCAPALGQWHELRRCGWLAFRIRLARGSPADLDAAAALAASVPGTATAMLPDIVRWWVRLHGAAGDADRLIAAVIEAGERPLGETGGASADTPRPP